MSWKPGPLPPDTWWWGGCVPYDLKNTGFFFASFRGDHVILNPGEKDHERRLEPHEVRYYNNSLDLPPTPREMGSTEPQKQPATPYTSVLVLLALLGLCAPAFAQLPQFPEAPCTLPQFPERPKGAYSVKPWGKSSDWVRVFADGREAGVYSKRLKAFHPFKRNDGGEAVYGAAETPPFTNLFCPCGCDCLLDECTCSAGNRCCPHCDCGTKPAAEAPRRTLPMPREVRSAVTVPTMAPSQAWWYSAPPQPAVTTYPQPAAFHTPPTQPAPSFAATPSFFRGFRGGGAVCTT